MTYLSTDMHREIMMTVTELLVLNSRIAVKTRNALQRHMTRGATDTSSGLRRNTLVVLTELVVLYLQNGCDH